MMMIMSKGHWSSLQGHKVYNKAIEWPVWNMHYVEGPASSFGWVWWIYIRPTKCLPTNWLMLFV